MKDICWSSHTGNTEFGEDSHEIELIEKLFCKNEDIASDTFKTPFNIKLPIFLNHKHPIM